MSSLKLAFFVWFPRIFSWPGETSRRTTRRRTRPTRASRWKIVAAGEEVDAQTVNKSGHPPPVFRALPGDDAGHVWSVGRRERLGAPGLRGQGPSTRCWGTSLTAKVCDDLTEVSWGRKGKCYAPGGAKTPPKNIPHRFS